MSEVRHLKKCIRENIKHINSNKLNDKADMESLIRFCGWIRNDASRVIRAWKQKT